jgi:hypothetical protein
MEKYSSYSSEDAQKKRANIPDSVRLTYYETWKNHNAFSRVWQDGVYTSDMWALKEVPVRSTFLQRLKDILFE